MAAIHQDLYGAADLKEIDFARHLHALVSGLFRSYQVQPGLINLVIDVDYLLLGLDAAIPLSLITNELVTNCLNYAFPNGTRGVLEIHLPGLASEAATTEG
jgi:two-component sensor histidine kinase